MRTLLFVLILSILTFSACKDNSTNPSSSKDVFPLKLGNQWTYRVSSYDSNDSLLTQYNDVWTIIADTLVLNERAFILESSNNKKYGFPLAALFIRSDGIYRLAQDNWNIELWYKYPVQQGNIYLLKSDTMKIGKTEMNLYLGGINYKCIEYLLNMNVDSAQTQNITYISLGIGRVYSSAKLYVKGKFTGEVTSELLSYSLK